MKNIVISVNSPAFSKGDRAVFRMAKDQWFAGTLTLVGSKGARILFDDGDTFKVTTDLLQYLKKIATTKKYKKPMSGLMAKSLYAVVPAVDAVPAKPVDPMNTPEMKEMLASPKGPKVIYKKGKDKWYTGILTRDETDKYLLMVFDDRETFPKVVKLSYSDNSRVYSLDSAKAQVHKSAITDAEAKAILTPDCRKLVYLVSKLVDASIPMSPSIRADLAQQVVEEANRRGLEAKSSGTSPILYRSIELPTVKFKNSLSTLKVTQPGYKFSVWAVQPATTCKYLNNFSYGVVTEWNVPIASIALDLGILLKNIQKNADALTRLGSANAQKRFIELVGSVAATNELILRSDPIHSPVCGVVTNSPIFKKKCSLLGIPIQKGPDGVTVYTSFNTIKDSLNELGLV